MVSLYRVSADGLLGRRSEEGFQEDLHRSAYRRLDPGQTICVVVSETGLKTEAEPPSRAGTAFDYGSLERLVHQRLGV